LAPATRLIASLSFVIDRNLFDLDQHLYKTIPVYGDFMKRFNGIGAGFFKA
jgi:hypothetical protein